MNSLLLSSEDAKPLAELISEELNTSYGLDIYHPDIEISKFPDGSPKIRLPENEEKKDKVFYLTNSYSLGTNGNENFVDMLNVFNILKQEQAQIYLINPLLFFQREDRSPKKINPIGLNVLFNAIDPYITGLIGVDAHNEQSTNIFDGQYTDLKASKVFIPYIQEKILKNKNLKDWIVFGSDHGSVTTNTHYNNKLNISSSGYADKVRDGKTGKTSIRNLIGYDGQKNIITIDDVLDTGGSLYKLIDEIKGKNSIKNWEIFTTHITGSDKKTLESICEMEGVQLNVSNSCLTNEMDKLCKDLNIKVHSIAPNLSTAIYSTIKNIPLRKLYTN